MGEFCIHKAIKETEMDIVFHLREVIFIEGQGVPREIEMDGLEDGAEHFLVRLSGKPIGCARIRYPEGKAKIERVAILEKYRGRGFGVKLMEYLIEHSLESGYEKIYLHAQVTAKGFYEKFGFIAIGDHFDEAGIEHVKMELYRNG